MKITQKHIEDALRRNMGFRTKTAKQLGLKYNTLVKRIQRSKELQELEQQILEEMLDFTENKLYKLIQNENLSAIFYFLNNKGKSRGYGKTDIEIKPQLNKLSEIIDIVKNTNVD